MRRTVVTDRRFAASVGLSSRHASSNTRENTEHAHDAESLRCGVVDPGGDRSLKFQELVDEHVAGTRIVEDSYFPDAIVDQVKTGNHENEAGNLAHMGKKAAHVGGNVGTLLEPG